jgi:hypothetical protein
VATRTTTGYKETIWVVDGCDTAIHNPNTVEPIEILQAEQSGLAAID